MALILDIETIGFPKKQPELNSTEKDESYKMSELYNSARIVQISMMICDDKLNMVKLDDFIIKSDGFKIYNSHVHNITNEISKNHGHIFKNISDYIYMNLIQTSHIIAHNAQFDINVLKAELYRHGLNYIIDELEKKQIICSMLSTKNIVEAKNKFSKIKNPSLAELYNFACNEPIQNAHNSKYDVINLHKAIKNLYDAKKLFENENFVFKNDTRKIILMILINKHNVYHKNVIDNIANIHELNDLNFIF